jgi:hypothetical protein
MAEHGVCEIVIKVLPVLNGYRAAVYMNGVLEKLGPTTPDYDVALLYANYMKEITQSLITGKSDELE